MKFEGKCATNQIFFSQIKSPHVIQSWFKSNHDLICPSMVYESRINSVDELKQRLHDVWHGVQQHIIELAVSQWMQRLTACLRRHGRHFEHLLWAYITQTWVESQYVRINYCWTLFIKITKKLLTAKSTNFQVQQFLKVRQLHKIGEVGK